MLLLISTLAMQPLLNSDVIDTTYIGNLGFSHIVNKVRLTGTSEKGNVSGGFQRQGTDFSSLSLSLSASREPSFRQNEISAISSGFSLGGLEDLPQGSWSGLPIGDKSHRITSESVSFLYVFVGPYACQSRIGYSGTRNSDGRTFSWSGSDKHGDRLNIEGITRDSLANAMGLELAPRTNATVNGQSIAGTKKTADGKVYVPVQAWCAAKGISLAVNRAHGTLSFSRNSVMFVLPVAADKAKRGSEWRTISGFVVRTDGKHYAPLTGLESLL